MVQTSIVSNYIATTTTVWKPAVLQSHCLVRRENGVATTVLGVLSPFVHICKHYNCGVLVVLTELSAAIIYPTAMTRVMKYSVVGYFVA